MQKLISLLRGVNMAGHNKIRMTDLTSLYKKLGFNDVESYIQSGNVVFTNTANLSVADVGGTIEKTILKEFKYEIPVIVRTPDEFRNIIGRNPFHKEKNFDTSKLAVIFLREPPTALQTDKVKNIDYPPDKFMISGREIFIYCPNGFGRTKLYTNFFENKMQVVGTARNWKTINTLLEIAEKI